MSLTRRSLSCPGEQLKPFLHSYDILGAGMLWKPKEAKILTNFIDQPMNIGNLRTKNVLTRCFTKNFKVQNEECHYYVFLLLRNNHIP
jgi:hypothetical protein